MRRTIRVVGLCAALAAGARPRRGTLRGYVLARWANMIVALAHLLFNIGFLVEATKDWEDYLGACGAIFTVLILWTALKWAAAE